MALWLQFGFGARPFWWLLENCDFRVLHNAPRLFHSLDHTFELDDDIYLHTCENNYHKLGDGNKSLKLRTL